MSVDLGDEVGDLLLSHSVANVGEFADVLEGVSGPGAAELLDLLDEHAKAVEVLGSLGRVGNNLEVLGEETVNEVAVVELLLDSGGVLLRGVSDGLVHEEVKIVLAGVDQGTLFRLAGVNVVLHEGLALLLHGVQEADALTVALERAKGLIHDSEVAELHDGGRGGQCFNGFELLLEGLDVDVSLFSVLHPADGEEVTEAGVDARSADVGITSTVSSIGGEGGVGGGKGVDVLRSVQVGEHGARLAGLEVEHELTEHASVLHLLEGGVELVGIDPVSGALRGADETGTTVIDEVDEDLGLGVGPKDGA